MEQEGIITSHAERPYRPRRTPCRCVLCGKAGADPERYVTAWGELVCLECADWYQPDESKQEK